MQPRCSFHKLHALLDSLAKAYQQAGLEEPISQRWPQLKQPSEVKPYRAVVKNHFPDLKKNCDPAFAPLLQQLIQAADFLQWGQTYGRGDINQSFLDNYAWAEIAGSKGPVASSTMALGFLLLGPNTRYPIHSHPAVEYYLPIVGQARWYDEQQGWREQSPGDLIFHPSGLGHAMQTQQQPLLAAYIWSGEQLSTEASFNKAG